MHTENKNFTGQLGGLAALKAPQYSGKALEPFKISSRFEFQTAWNWQFQLLNFSPLST